MSFIDMVTYRAACEKAHSSVNKVALLEAIDRVYAMWFEEKRLGKKIIFHAYFGLALLDMGIENLFDAERYRKALAAYFQPRALKKLAEIRSNSAPKRSNNPVEKASKHQVRVRVTEDVSIEFRATKPSGELKWSHVKEVYWVRRGSGEPDVRKVHAAQVQALAIMNDKRQGR